MNDQAIYQCFLSNEAGHISASTLIKIVSYAPKFSKSIQNRTVFSDTNIQLSCGNVEGSPKPNITWSRIYYTADQFSDHTASNDDPIISADDHPERYTDYEGDLIIKNVNKKHEGWYKCSAKNLIGSIETRMFLKVNKKTEIIEPPMNISATKGQSALFKCTVSKEDNIDVELQWKFNDMLLEFQFRPDGTLIERNLNNFRQFLNGSLQVIEAKNTDIGIYKCSVKSTNNILAGNDSKIAYLNVVELPYSPINIKVSINVNTNRSVNLTWDSSFDGNSKIIKYIIHARIISDNENIVQIGNQNYRKQIEFNDWFVIKVLYIFNQLHL